jgi:hypothetical protein
LLRPALGVYRELFLLFLLSCPLLAFWFKQWPWVIFGMWAFLFLNGVLLRSPIIIAAVLGGGTFAMLASEEFGWFLRMLLPRWPPVLLLLGFMFTAGLLSILLWMALPPSSTRAHAGAPSSARGTPTREEGRAENTE